jgi:drug/metabolite transporter (DMT)-like permease
MRVQSGPDRLALAALIGIAVLGGANFVAVRISNFGLPPFWGAAIRFLAATALLFLIVAVRRIEFPRGRALVGAIIYGVLGFGVFYGLMYYALVNVNAGEASVISSLVPMVTLFLASAQRQEYLDKRRLAGGLVTIAGTAVIFSEQLTLAIPLFSLLALLGAVFAVAETSIVLKHFPRSDPFGTNAVAMLIGSAVLLALSMIARERWFLPTQATTILTVAYLVFPGSVLLFALFLFVVSRWTASATNYSFVLMPIVTVLVALVIVGEVVTPAFLAGTFLVLVGVYFGAIVKGAHQR